MKKQNQSGAAILVYLLIMAVVVTVLLIATYSRLLLALKRGQSTTDAILINYSAESEISDWLARLSEGYLGNPFSVHETKQVGNTTLTITGSQTGNTQKIVINADRPYASTQIEADRTIENFGNRQPVDIIMGLDCTESMNTVDSGDTQTRIANLKAAALNFVASIPNDGRFRLGVFMFGIDAQWLQTSNGQDITLTNNISRNEITKAINAGFGSTRNTSPACSRILDATSVGTAFVFPQDYFASLGDTSNKKIELVITDGEPNSRIPHAGCDPNIYCPSLSSLCDKGGYGTCSNSGKSCAQPSIDFLQCSVADTNTTLPNSNAKGIRDPNIDAYAVTISTAPNGKAATVLNTYLGQNYIPASRAGQLTTILSGILSNILSKRETITIHKSIPN